MRIATGGGAEALVPGGVSDGGACQQAWEAAGYTYAVWNQHEANIINAMGSQPTDKQIMVSLPQAPGGPPNVYDAAMDITKLLEYALANNIQIFELYPEEWLSANSPTWLSFVAADQAKYKAALQAAAATLGAMNGK
jgi:hypothetical protein